MVEQLETSIHDDILLTGLVSDLPLEQARNAKNWGFLFLLVEEKEKDTEQKEKS